MMGGGSTQSLKPKIIKIFVDNRCCYGIIIILMKANEFDKRFDDGRDISKYLDMSKARRPGQEQKRVNVDFPLWMIHLLDKEAKRLGVPRQSIIKVWIAERMKEVSP